MKTRQAGTLAILVVATILGPVLVLPHPAAAEAVERSTTFSVEGAYYLPDHKGYELESGGFAPVRYGPVDPSADDYPKDAPDPLYPDVRDYGRALGSSWGPAEIQAKIRHTVEIPLLAGPGPLTAGNNLALSVTGALTPVSARLELGATLTPIAFLNLYGGAMLGTGWNIGLFDGLGKILEGPDSADPELVRLGMPDPDSFEGAVIKSWIGGTFQFDLAALLPGDWNHVVTLLSPRLQYAWFSDARKGEAWMWEADIGENFNGWKLLGSYFLGYQMPLVLDTVGVLLETEQHLGYVAELSPALDGGWGSDFVIITIGSVMSFALSEKSSLAVLVQFRRERLYTPDTIFDEYYATREYAGTYWDFRRVAFSYTLKL